MIQKLIYQKTNNLYEHNHSPLNSWVQMWSTVKWLLFPWKEWHIKIINTISGWYDDGMLVRSCLYQSHLRHICFSLKIWGISLSLRTKNVVITSWQQIHIRCLLSQRCRAHWGTYSVGKSSICCSISLFLIMLSLKTYFGVKQVFKAVQLHCVILGLIRPVSLVLLTGSCESSLWGSLVCDQLPDALGSTVPDWQSSQLGWDARLRTGDMGQ